jgi:hypothetical protein
MVSDLFKEKKVAIIGSSPKILDHEHGAVIDAHDVVMRINLQCINGRPECKGSRTDIRYIGTNIKKSLMHVMREVMQSEIVVHCYDFDRWIIDEFGLPGFQSKIKMRDWLKIKNGKLLNGLKVHRNLTSGTNAIAVALDGGASEITLYGYSMNPENRMHTFRYDGEIDRYNYDTVVRAHGEPSVEVEIISRLTKHFPVRVA